MDYNSTIKYLYSQLPMFQRSGPAAYKNNLENTHKLDNYYVYPHRNFKIIHVAGTNGKGSVSHMLSSILMEAGYKTGMYTSPHLKDFRERITINGKKISEEDVAAWVTDFRSKNRKWKIEPSFFELTVAMAFDYFARRQVEVGVIEVGLGGRLDSTNIVAPELGIITNIGLDHTDLLGNTIEKIAAEKGGIIKEEMPVVIGEYRKASAEVFKDIAKAKRARLVFADENLKLDFATLGMDQKQWLFISKNNKTLWKALKLDLLGEYQQKNVLTVLTAVEILIQKGWGINETDIRKGLANTVKNTGLPGRWQIIGNNPLVVCDTAHNEDGIKAIVRQIDATPHKKLHFVFGTMADKNTHKILQLLPGNARYYFVAARTPRSLDANALEQAALAHNLNGKAYPSIQLALEKAKENADKRDMIFIGGSTFVVAEIL